MGSYLKVLITGRGFTAYRSARGGGGGGGGTGLDLIQSFSESLTPTTRFKKNSCSITVF